MAAPPASLVAKAVPPLVLLGAVLFAGRSVLADLDGRIFGVADTHWAEGVTWWYWNVATSPFRGINPLANDLHAWPVGYAHISLIGNFADAALAAPFFWLFEAPASYDLTVLAWLFFDAVAAWVCFSTWFGRPGLWGQVLPVAFALATTFQPLVHFFVEEGRPTQFLLGFVFLGFAGARRLLDDPERGSLGLLVVGTAGAFVCFWFNGFFLVLGVTLAALVALPGMDGARRRALARRGGLALGLAVAFAFPFGLPVLLDVLWGDGFTGVRLWTWPDTAHMAWFSARPWELVGRTPRYGMVVPWSALAAGLVAALLAWRRPDRRALGWLVAGAAWYLLTLGPYLRFDDEPVRVAGRLVALPWAWFTWGVPFYSRLSYPYMAFPFLLVVIFGFVGAGLARLAERGAGGRALAWGLAAAVVVEVGLRFGFTLVSSPFAIPDFYRQLARDEQVRAIVEYPFGAMDYRQVYQTVHGKPMINSRGNEDNFLVEAVGLAQIFEAHRALSTLLAWQRSGGTLGGIDRHDVDELADSGYDVLVVSAQAVHHSQRLQHLGFQGVVRELSAVMGAPDYRGDDLVAWRLRPSRVP